MSSGQRVEPAVEELAQLDHAARVRIAGGQAVRELAGIEGQASATRRRLRPCDGQRIGRPVASAEPPPVAEHDRLQRARNGFLHGVGVSQNAAEEAGHRLTDRHQYVFEALVA